MGYVWSAWIRDGVFLWFFIACFGACLGRVGKAETLDRWNSHGGIVGHLGWVKVMSMEGVVELSFAFRVAGKSFFQPRLLTFYVSILSQIHGRGKV